MQPIVIDLGKTNQKSVKNLKRGQGKLLDEVHHALDQVKANLGADAEGKELVPVVLVYKKKEKKSKALKWMW